ncbi:YybH family protein [Flammeovirga aprica]|uniref:Nuclear transport factor 2 family protein n=1 Tax=Flammeovirga aprica JL-4 TaxID=694437 RepID=A0A7X9XAP8_9BACT|nr:nuclear transport factor 2 family protein [Flammeovirga aprica]NME69897.1 nuclear transport factor 2 family protein [Flammeovirga aprica JL-4]
MIKYIYLFLFSILIGCQTTTSNPEQEIQQIHKVLKTQEKAWNTGDLDQFMIGYWESEKLMFIGKSGLTYGWEQTLANYKKGYPDVKAMGKLTFTLIETELLAENVALVVGKWHLSRETNDLQGHFSLVWKKIDNKWVIIADHSS